MSGFDSNLSLGVDLGGSHISCIVIDKNGSIKCKLITQISNRNDMNVIDILDLLVECIKKALDTCPLCNSIGIGIPGNVDPVHGIARYLPNYGWLSSVNIGEYIENKLNIKVKMRNDGRCAAIAEYKFGVGNNAKVFAMLTLGTGIGGALINNGILFDGSSYDAGDFGHHVICSGKEAFECVCGKSGCFEYHASADGLVRHYHREVARIIDSNLELNNYENHKVNNAHDVIMLVRDNNQIAIAALKSYKNDLSTGLANLITFYNPDVIALGGGLSQAPEIFQGLIELVDSKTLQATRGKVKIIPAALSVDAGAIGAALLGFIY